MSAGDDDDAPTSARLTETATVVERPAAAAAALPRAMKPERDSSPSLDGGTSVPSALVATTISSPRIALDHAEILRTRNFCLVGMGIAAAALLLIPQLPGGYYTTRCLLGGILTAVAGMLYLLHRTRSPATYHDGYGVMIGWYVPVVAVSTAVPFFGPFSPVPILLVLGIFFTGLGSSRAIALVTYMTCAAMQGVTAGLVIFGTIDDPGFIHANYLPSSIQTMCQVLIQVVLLATYAIARASRRSSLAALSELEKAVRIIAQREGLLEEARAELRGALGNGRGRFTDQRIGNFELGDIIGRGAMGEVYQGVDVRDQQPVAVKMLAHASLGNADHVERFLRELQTAATISSPNVVRVIAVGEHPLPHLVMERLRGRDLAALLRSKKLLEPDRVIDLVRQVGAGITAAAEVGVIHRDLKPQNLFLAGTTWKILDFGISRVLASSDTLTAGHIVGTPAYMAPEQARGVTVDHRTDLYALAAVAYRALTGHSLFASGALADTLYHVVHSAPRRPSSLADLPRDVDLALAIGVAKDPANRFATASELANALDAALGAGLSDPLRARGEALDRDGAWAA